MKLIPCPKCSSEIENSNCASCGASETMVAWCDAADKYLARGQYENAERFYKIALALLERRHISGHPQIAMSLYGLARLYFIRGQHKEAELFYKRAREVIEKVLPHHPKAGKIINGLAELYLHQKQYTNAEALFKQALAIQEKALGRDHPEVNRVLKNLSIVYGKTKKAGTAKKLRRSDSCK